MCSIKRHGVISIGSHGCIKIRTEREYFKAGLRYVVKALEPSALIIYGTAPDEVFAPYKRMGIDIVQFDSYIMQIRKENK